MTEDVIKKCFESEREEIFLIKDSKEYTDTFATSMSKSYESSNFDPAMLISNQSCAIE